MSRYSIVLVVFSLCCSTASAIKPDSGWYWNPDRFGAGFNIEINERSDGSLTMFIAAFTHDVDGNPTWYTMSGEYSERSPSEWRSSGEIGSISAPLFETTGGPCVSCPYEPELISTEPSSLGIATMTFTDNRNILLDWAGGQVLLRHFDFNNGFAANVDFLRGEWESYSKISGDYLLGETRFTPIDGPITQQPYFDDALYYRFEIESETSDDLDEYLIYSPSQNQFIYSDYDEATGMFGYESTGQHFRMFVSDQEILGYFVDPEDSSNQANNSTQIYIRRPLPEQIDVTTIPLQPRG